MEEVDIQTDRNQLEHAILQIFHRTMVSEEFDDKSQSFSSLRFKHSFKNSANEKIFVEDYQNNTKLYRRIQTIQTNRGRFMGETFSCCDHLELSFE